MKSYVLLITACMAACFGCQTVRVTRAKTPLPTQNNNANNKTEKADGIPFYIKKAVCKHEVVWLEPVYTLSLEEITTSAGVDPKPAPIPRGAATLSLSGYRGTKNQDFLLALNGVDQTLEVILKAWNAVTTDPTLSYFPSAFPDLNNRILTSNSNAPSTYVDYSQPYYLNAKQPLAGSSKLDGKMAADGTLTEASSEVENKTLETLLASLPIKEVITGGLGFAAKAQNPKQDKQLKLTIAVTGYKHTLSQLDTSMLMPCAALGTDLSGQYLYLREDVSGTVEKKDDSKASKIRLSGEVVLPEDKSSSKTETKRAEK
jgi:hypothetical protein